MLDVSTGHGKWKEEAMNLSDKLEKMEVLEVGQEIEKEKYADFMVMIYPACTRFTNKNILFLVVYVLFRLHMVLFLQ